MIRLVGMQRAFGSFSLGPLSIVVGRGDYTVLLGPSGAGKSLLLQMLAGVQLPAEGSMHLGERDVTRLPPEDRRIGLVFQHAALFPHLSVRDNIGYGLRTKGFAASERRRRVDDWLERLGLRQSVDRPVRTLSGGEAQKVAIARALAVEPEVLLLDEPLGAVDHNGRSELQELLKQLHAAGGLTLVHVTHSRDEARGLATHCAVMRDGQIEQAGPVDTLFDSPATPFVADFLGVAGPPAAR